MRISFVSFIVETLFSCRNGRGARQPLQPPYSDASTTVNKFLITPIFRSSKLFPQPYGAPPRDHRARSPSFAPGLRTGIPSARGGRVLEWRTACAWTTSSPVAVHRLMCYIRYMREWMREKMRRRSKRGPNNSEATGKLGQETPVNQPAPLRPSYEAAPAETSAASAASNNPEPEIHELDTFSTPLPLSPEAAAEFGAPASQQPGRLEVETQPESPSVPPPAPEAPGHAPKGYVVLTIGLPGSGKTTWFKRRGVNPLSSDMLRAILFDDIDEQRYQGLVFSTLRSLLRARLIAKMPWNYVDATNLSPHERRQWIKMAKSFGYEVQAVFFDVPLEVCLERNSKRDRQVTDEVMRSMADRLKPPVFKEGFDKITVVRVKAAVNAPAENAVEAAVEG